MALYKQKLDELCAWVSVHYGMQYKASWEAAPVAHYYLFYVTTKAQDGQMHGYQFTISQVDLVSHQSLELLIKDHFHTAVCTIKEQLAKVGTNLQYPQTAGGAVSWNTVSIPPPELGDYSPAPKPKQPKAVLTADQLWARAAKRKAQGTLKPKAKAEKLISMAELDALLDIKGHEAAVAAAEEAEQALAKLKLMNAVKLLKEKK